MGPLFIMASSYYLLLASEMRRKKNLIKIGLAGLYNFKFVLKKQKYSSKHKQTKQLQFTENYNKMLFSESAGGIILSLKFIQ